ncbi:MAG: BamA/TamA family outer membrane protein [Gemmatimonadales bacterium]|nr:BamA/TamA family outer membrane protein [Gemmatimonadales bacterium]
MRAIRLLVLLLLGASALAAQESDAQSRSPWRLSYFPFISGGANDGPILSARLRYWQPAEYEDRVTARAALDVGAGISPQGSRYVAVKFSAPLVWEGWRFQAGTGAERLARFGYFGLGNDTQKNDDLVDESNPFLYRVRRTRYKAVAEVTRQIKGPLAVAFQADLESAKFTTLPGPSLFDDDFGEELKQDDVAGRLALVYDTRDIEYNTHQGVLLEAGVQHGSGGDGYTRLYGAFRGYLSVREGTVIAARVAGSGMGGSPTLNARFTLPAWEDWISVLGGETSHRSLDTGRLAGRGTLFGNLEVRHDLLPFGDLGAVTLLAFVDAGRVFEEESWRLTTDDLKVGGGGGVALRILRSTIFTFNFAGGPDGFNYSVGSGWMF